MKSHLPHTVYTFLLVTFFSYTFFIYLQPGASRHSADADVLSGKALWQEKNCGACHQLFGLGGFLGPDLTNVYSTEGKGVAYITGLVKSGTSIMPAYKISDEEARHLAAFFRHVDASGRAHPKFFTPNRDGTIEPK